MTRLVCNALWLSRSVLRSVSRSVLLVPTLLTRRQLNDIISLAVGLWAVNLARQESNDRYSYGV